MMKIFRSSALALLIASIFIISGCTCKNSWMKGALIGTYTLGAAGAISDHGERGDDDHEGLLTGMAAGAVIGGLIGALTEECDKAPVKVAEVVDVDTDGDGVVDRLDDCPGTPKGTPVDYKGCPLKDSDNDGVYDDKDKCPGTPAGVKVNVDGCPVDSDGDGVTDDRDKCPGTPAGVKVDANGCPVVLDEDKDNVPDDIDECPKTPDGATVNKAGCWVLNSVLFEINQATIKSAFYAELDKVVNILNSNPALGIEIEGHTCSLGSDANNLKLSERRAKAVMDYLISKGIDKSRLSSKGYGETKPAESNDTDEGRQANRRVQLSPVW
ncbi:MAG: OmpA family protein [Deltaproteobacteria bacterium]|nr:OmpA family protein [Deltaproteobacteria bacterium]